MESQVVVAVNNALVLNGLDQGPIVLDTLYANLLQRAYNVSTRGEKIYGCKQIDISHFLKSSYSLRLYSDRE